jgi:hypothetical protein
VAPSPEQLLAALRRLPPRSAQLLTFRFARELRLEGAAQLYGISVHAVQVHTHRAARLLEVALRRPDGPPVRPLDVPALTDAEEARGALRLEESLAADPELNPEPASPDAELALPLRALVAHGPEVQRLAAEHDARLRDSPAGRRADWLRRLALTALVAVAAWLYLRSGE